MYEKTQDFLHAKDPKTGKVRIDYLIERPYKVATSGAKDRVRMLRELRKMYDPMEGQPDPNADSGPGDTKLLRWFMNALLERQANTIEVGPPGSDPCH